MSQGGKRAFPGWGGVTHWFGSCCFVSVLISQVQQTQKNTLSVLNMKMKRAGAVLCLSSWLCYHLWSCLHTGMHGGWGLWRPEVLSVWDPELQVPPLHSNWYGADSLQLNLVFTRLNDVHTETFNVCVCVSLLSRALRMRSAAQTRCVCGASARSTPPEEQRERSVRVRATAGRICAVPSNEVSPDVPRDRETRDRLVSVNVKLYVGRMFNQMYCVCCWGTVLSEKNPGIRHSLETSTALSNEY